jgi:sugar lactone lactonase YvrE
MLTGLTISNGIGWSPDGTTMYLADSGTGDISAFDFDQATGALGRRRTVVHVTTPNAVPDGLTVDHRGNLWVALWDGGALVQYRPDGLLLATVPLPVDRPTSCAFGDPGGETLFITTAREGLEDAALARQPDAGRLLRLDSPGVTGPPCQPYRGQLAAT